jgi:hypothetical protein
MKAEFGFLDSLKSKIPLTYPSNLKSHELL